MIGARTAATAAPGSFCYRMAQFDKLDEHQPGKADTASARRLPAKKETCGRPPAGQPASSSARDPVEMCVRMGLKGSFRRSLFAARKPGHLAPVWPTVPGRDEKMWRFKMTGKRKRMAWSRTARQYHPTVHRTLSTKSARSKEQACQTDKGIGKKLGRAF